MKSIFLAAGGLLGVSGFFQLVELASAGITSHGVFSALVVGLFGAAYIVTAYYLLRGSDAAVTFGMLVPGSRLLASVLQVVPAESMFNAVFIAVDVIVIAICAYLYVAGRAPIRRVR